jgi:hypothetical protein
VIFLALSDAKLALSFSDCFAHGLIIFPKSRNPGDQKEDAKFNNYLIETLLFDKPA